MGVKQRQHVEQAIMGSQRQHAARIVSGQAHIALGQWYHLRPRRGARRQQDEGVIVAPRGAVGVCRTNRRSGQCACAEMIVRPRHEIDHRDIQRPGDVATRRVHIGAGDQPPQLQFAEIALQLVCSQIGIDGDTGTGRCDGDQRKRTVGAARQCDRNPVGRGDAKPAQGADQMPDQLVQLAVGESRPPRCEERGRRRRLPPMEVEKAADMGKSPGFGASAVRFPTRSGCNVRQCHSLLI